MTNEDPYELRRAILAQLEAAYPASMPEESMLSVLKLCGFEVDGAELKRQCQYLCERGFVRFVSSKISPSQTRTRITPEGVDYIQSGGF